MGECYPPIPSRRERRIYAANAAVQRYRVCLFLRMGIKPCNAGANMAGAVFDGRMVRKAVGKNAINENQYKSAGSGRQLGSGRRAES